MKNTLLAFSITLALDTPREEVLEVIDNIRDVFNIADDVPGSVSPATLAGAGSATPPSGVVTNVAANADLDSNGLPWDERIHSSNKAKVADGSWRMRRGVDKSLVARIEKELKATMGQPAAAAETTPPAPPAPPAAAAPPAPPAPPAAAAPPAPPANPAYTNFVNFIAEQTTAGRVDAEWVKASLVNFGVVNGDIQNLAHRPDLIPNIEAAIKTALGL